MKQSQTGNISTSKNSAEFGVVIITIPSPAADVTYGTSLPCRTCYVSLNTGTNNFYVDSVTATTATAYKVLSTALGFEIPVDDVNKIHLIGTAAEKVQILWRS